MPKLKVRNSTTSKDVINENIYLYQPLWKAGCVKVQSQLRNEGFCEVFELQQFPFDLQKCSMNITIHNSITTRTELGKVDVVDPGRFFMPVAGFVHQKVELTEWDILAP